MDTIDFTPSRYKSLKKAYDKAVEDKVNSFIWQGYEFVTDYAKYMLEFLASKFEKGKK